MFNSFEFKELLGKLNIRFVAGVPDTLLNDLCLFFDVPSNCEEHIICAEAVLLLLLQGLFWRQAVSSSILQNLV